MKHQLRRTVTVQFPYSPLETLVRAAAREYYRALMGINVTTKGQSRKLQRGKAHAPKEEAYFCAMGKMAVTSTYKSYVRSFSKHLPCSIRRVVSCQKTLSDLQIPCAPHLSHVNLLEGRTTDMLVIL